MRSSRFAQKINKDFLRIAHRGACVFAPENTLESFQLAVEIGVDMIETDVRMTRDEVLVLAHDASMIHHSEMEERFPNRQSYLLRDTLFSEIRQLTDIGIRHVQEVRLGKSATRDCFHAITPQEHQTFLTSSQLNKIQCHQYLVPSLDETIDWLKQQPTVLLNLELKTFPQSHPKIVPAFIQALKHYPLERLLISSFDHYALLEIKKQLPSLSTAHLHYDRVIGSARYGNEILNVDAVHPGVAFLEQEDVIQQEFQEYHQQKLGVHVWTLDDPSWMQKLLFAGVDGICTNFPNRLNDVLQKMNRPSSGKS